VVRIDGLKFLDLKIQRDSCYVVEKLVSMHEDDVPALACVQELRELFAGLR